MKKSLFAILVLFFVFIKIGQAEISSSLFSYYNFDSSSVIDLSGNGNNGSLVNNPNFVNDRFEGKALNFSKNQYVDIPNIISLAHNNGGKYPITLQAWVKTTDKTSVMIVSGIYRENNKDDYFDIRISSGVVNSNVKTGVNISTLNGVDVADGNWHQLVSVFESPTSRKLYIDGVEIDSENTTINYPQFISKLSIGASRANYKYVSPGAFFNGSIDDVRLYKRALSSSDVKVLYELQKTDSSNITNTPVVPVTPVAPVNPVTPVSPVVKNTTKIIKHKSGGVDFTWEFDCGGRECRYGNFVNGEYWVVPIDDLGNRVSGVRITRISPDGIDNGAEVNPKSNSKQGILPMYGSYDSNLNIMTKLPYLAQGGQSIFKANTKTSGCGTSAVAIGCVHTDDVLTILQSIPEDDGKKTFRPPFHGDWKPLYTIDRVRLDRLSSFNNFISNPNFEGIINRWTVPHYDTTHGGGFSGEFYRGTSPIGVIDDYAAGQASRYLEDIASLLGNHDKKDKAPAAYALIQKGIDVYGIFKLGIPFNSGAGQHLGKKPALAFFAAMYDDKNILDEVRGIASNSYYLNNSFFQEDSQIKAGYNGIALWNGGDENESLYWTRMYPGIDNNGASGDPYGYIDGPAGGAFPTETKGRSYIQVSGGPLIGFAFVQHLMPWLKYANNDSEILNWSDRIYGGYGMTGFDGGFWAGPDYCAPKGEVQNYKITWGPDPKNPGQCIKHNGDPMKDGRMSALHDRNISFVYVPTTLSTKWNSMRKCLDPNSATYKTGACSGLVEVGTSVSSSVPDAINNSTPTNNPSASVNTTNTESGNSKPSSGGSGGGNRGGGGSNSTDPSSVSINNTNTVSSSVFKRNLSFGMRGEDVKSLQTKLNVTPISGYFGPVTQNALKNYQAKQGIVQTGILDSVTISKLDSYVVGGSQNQSMSEIERQLLIKQLQAILNELLRQLAILIKEKQSTM